METTISLRWSELLESGMDQIAKIVQSAATHDDPVIRVTVQSGINEAYIRELERREKELAEGKGITFTMEELEAYVKDLVK